MKQGDIVLIWGASGGLGSYATQYAAGRRRDPGLRGVQRGQGRRSCRSMGAELIIDRSAEDYRFWKDEHTQDPKEWMRLGKRIRELTGGDDVDIVFEHPGRETFGASVFVARKGGTIVTCASTTGFLHEYDNRYLWMNLKRIIGSHFANYREAWEANRLIARGKIHPTLSRTYPLERDRPGGARRPPQPAPGQGRRPVPRPGGGSRRARPRAAGPPRDRDQPVPQRLTAGPDRSTSAAGSDSRPPGLTRCVAMEHDSASGGDRGRSRVAERAGPAPVRRPGAGRPAPRADRARGRRRARAAADALRAEAAAAARRDRRQARAPPAGSRRRPYAAGRTRWRRRPAGSRPRWPSPSGSATRPPTRPSSCSPTPPTRPRSGRRLGLRPPPTSLVARGPARGRHPARRRDGRRRVDPGPGPGAPRQGAPGRRGDRLRGPRGGRPPPPRGRGRGGPAGPRRCRPRSRRWWRPPARRPTRCWPRPRSTPRQTREGLDADVERARGEPAALLSAGADEAERHRAAAREEADALLAEAAEQTAWAKRTVDEVLAAASDRRRPDPVRGARRGRARRWPSCAPRPRSLLAQHARRPPSSGWTRRRPGRPTLEAEAEQALAAAQAEAERRLADASHRATRTVRGRRRPGRGDRVAARPAARPRRRPTRRPCASGSPSRPRPPSARPRRPAGPPGPRPSASWARPGPRPTRLRTQAHRRCSTTPAPRWPRSPTRRDEIAEELGRLSGVIEALSVPGAPARDARDAAPTPTCQDDRDPPLRRVDDRT